MHIILRFWLTRTLEEAADVVLTEELSFVQNLFKEEKMELLYEITYNMYHESSQFSLVVASRGNVLADGNPSK